MRRARRLARQRDARPESQRNAELPGEAHRSGEEPIQRIHRRARFDERLEELLVGDLRIAERARPDEVLPAEVLDERMVRVDAGRWPLEGFAFESHLAPEDFLPPIRFIEHATADLREDRRIGMPDAGVRGALAWTQMEEKPGRHVLRSHRLRVPEMDPDVGLVRALVRREADVPIDPGKGSAERPRVTDEVRAELLQPRAGILDEADRRLLDRFLVSFLVRREPRLGVVLVQFPEEAHEFRGEVPRAVSHDPAPYNSLFFGMPRRRFNVRVWTQLEFDGTASIGRGDRQCVMEPLAFTRPKGEHVE